MSEQDANTCPPAAPLAASADGDRGGRRSGAATPETAEITRGACRTLQDMGYRVVPELPLGNGRRADVVGLDRRGSIVMVEVKSSLADYRADDKWPEYLPFCDEFYFAVSDAFPIHHLPPDPGIIIADAHQGVLIRPAVRIALGAPRRKAVMLRFARTAAARLEHVVDPRRDGSTRAL